jgi:hypothetical protein
MEMLNCKTYDGGVRHEDCSAQRQNHEEEIAFRIRSTRWASFLLPNQGSVAGSQTLRKFDPSSTITTRTRANNNDLA